MKLVRRLRSIAPAIAQPVATVNAGQTLSVVGSENSQIARAHSLLYTLERTHGGPLLTPEQARDVLRWADPAVPHV